MIHALPVLAGLLLISSSSLSSAIDTEADLDAEIGLCDSGTDDCITGYTSLMQKSVNLVGHRRHHRDKGRAGKRYVAGGQAQHATSLDISRLWIVGAVLFFAALAYVLIIRPAMATPTPSPRDFTVQNRSPDFDENQTRIHDSLGQDTYSLAIAIMVRDLRSIALGDEKPGLKISRIGFAIGLVVLTISMQVGVTVCTKQFVTPNQVADIRDAYDNFEQVMYNGKTELNANGKHRGIEGHFNFSAFQDLSDDAKSASCNIPFSQLSFLFLILTVWSITCIANLRQNIEMFLTLIICTKTKDNMRDCMVYWDQALDDAQKAETPTTRADTSFRNKSTDSTVDGKQIPVQVITGLTIPVKVFLVICVFLPEFLSTSYILWLGSRWLTATNDFGNIVSNAVALEFILQLKYLLFYALASERNKRDLAFTGLMPNWQSESAGFMTYFNTIVWIAVTLLWVTVYIFFLQQVLPDYKWDVHQVCNDWLVTILTASGGDD